MKSENLEDNPEKMQNLMPDHCLVLGISELVEIQPCTSFITFKDKNEIKATEYFRNFGSKNNIILNLHDPLTAELIKNAGKVFCFGKEDSEKEYKLSKKIAEGKEHFESYKKAKLYVEQNELKLSKEEIYEEMLKPFKHQKISIYDGEAKKSGVYYVCKYKGCDKEFTQTWNLLDHVRMHEGVKPYKGSTGERTFTQKSNLKKHYDIQHSKITLLQRKKYRGEVCSKIYTERYNLMVRNFA